MDYTRHSGTEVAAPSDRTRPAGAEVDAPGDVTRDKSPCECCGGPCDNLSDHVCFTLSSTCANLNGLKLTGVESAGLPCRHWSYTGFTITSGDCEFSANVDFYCNCGASPCPQAASVPTCAYVTVGGSNNCFVGPGGQPLGTWRLVTAPDGNDDKLPVTWTVADPPVGTATGYVVFDTPGDCACPCPGNTPVSITITNGACAPPAVVCAWLPLGGITVTIQNVAGAACLDGFNFHTSNFNVPTNSWIAAFECVHPPRCSGAILGSERHFFSLACDPNVLTNPHNNYGLFYAVSEYSFPGCLGFSGSLFVDTDLSYVLLEFNRTPFFAKFLVTSSRFGVGPGAQFYMILTE